MPPPQSVISAEEYDPLHTMSALNMAAVSINRILSTQDRIVLDQEYTSIMNNLNLGNIRPDSDIMELYRKIMDVISQKRLRAEEAELLQANYDVKMKSDLSKALTSAGSAVMKAGIDIVSKNVRGLIRDIALGVKSVYIMYQGNPELRAGMNKKSWELKAADLEDMNELQKQLLTSSWNLLNQYKLPDSARLVENVIKEFYQAVSVADSSRRLRMLRELEGNCGAYPPYWYYRAKAARESGKPEEGRKCLDKFAEVWRPVLRQDSFMLEVCKFRLHDLLTDGKAIDEVREEAVKYLDLAKEHTPRSDWADNLFIGTMYFALGEKEKGLSCVRINEDFAGEKQISQIVIRQMEAGELDAAELSEELQFLLGNKDIIPLHILANILAETDSAKFEALKRGFLSLYASEWQALEMNSKLQKLTAKRELFSELEEVMLEFISEYEDFLRRFQEKYYAMLQNDLREKGARDFNEFHMARIRELMRQREKAEEKAEGIDWGFWLYCTIFVIVVAVAVLVPFLWIPFAVFDVIFFGWIGYMYFFGGDSQQDILFEIVQPIYTSEFPAKYWAEIEPIIKKAVSDTLE